MHLVVSDLGLHGLPMSHKKDTRLIRVEKPSDQDLHYYQFCDNSCFRSHLIRVFKILNFVIFEFAHNQIKWTVINSMSASADYFCKQFRPRSGPTKCWA